MTEKNRGIDIQKIHTGKSEGFWFSKKYTFTIDGLDGTVAVVSGPIKARNAVEARKIALNPNSKTIWQLRK